MLVKASLSMLSLIIIISLSTGHFLTAPQLSKKLIDEVLHCAGDNQFFTPTQSEASRLFPQFENCNINQCRKLGKIGYFILSQNTLKE